MKSFIKSIFFSTVITSLISVSLLSQSKPNEKAGNRNKNIEIYDLRCEGLKNPLGIDVIQPRLSWKMHSQVRGQKQTAYRILISDNLESLEKENGDLWDTGKINSDQSIQITYSGKDLHSEEFIYWKVQVWGKEGEASSWSETQRWSMGLLNLSDWKGEWIGLDKDVGSDNSNDEFHRLSARMLRKEFEINKTVKSAQAYICGMGLFECYINGKKVGDQVLAPALSQYNKRAYYMTFDVTNYLKDNENAVGVILGNGRFFAPRRTLPVQTVNYGYPKLLFQMRILYSDGTVDYIVSNQDWKLTANGPIRANNEYDGEEYDARMEMNGWNEPGFDDHKWMKAEIVQPASPQLSAQMNEPIRVTGDIKPVSMTEWKPGTFIFDMGQNMVGWVRLKVTGQAGTIVKLRFGESLKPDSGLYTGNLRSAKQTDTYILKGQGIELYEPRFTYHGFRYVEVTGYPGKPDIESITGRVVNDDLEQTGTFQTSNNLINQIYKNTVWGIRGNYRSMPTDCPQRDERHGWLGDRAIESRGESYVFDISKLYAKWLQDIHDAQLDNGSLPDLAPNYWSFYNDNVTWGGTYHIIPDMLYNQYDDKNILSRDFSSMEKWFSHMDGYLDDGIMPRDTYGDWCVPPINRKINMTEDTNRITNGKLIGTSYYYYISKLMSKYANILGKQKESHFYAEKAAGLRKAFNDKFYNNKLSQYDNGSETSTVLALGLGLAEESNKNKLFEKLNDQISTVDSGHGCTGLIGCQWLMRTLNQFGRPDLAYTILTRNTYPGFGYMIKKGATTIWELWNGDTGDPSMNSQNHVMLTGDVIPWMFEDLAGIKSDEKSPGFKKTIMYPQIISDLKFVNASHESPFGKISSYWMQQNHQLIWKVDIPVNTTADIYLPCSNAEDVTESGNPLKTSEGLNVIGNQNGRILVTVASGSYSFKISNPIKIVSAPVLYRNKITGQTELISADSSSKIYYTTDNSIPDEHSKKYDTPFNQVNAVTIRAKTFSAEGIESAETKAVLDQLPIFPPKIIPDKMLVEEPGSTSIKMLPQTPGSEVYYTLDGSNPSAKSVLYKNQISVNNNTLVKAVAIKKGWAPSSIAEQSIFFTIPRKVVRIEGGVDPRYSEGGENALIDSKLGSDNYRDSTWLGFEGKDMQADIDLGKQVDVNRVSVGFLEDQDTWIFLPEEVEIFYSKDGKEFIPLKKILIDAKEPSKPKQVKYITLKFDKINTRYIRVRAKNIKTCPEWHTGAGGKAWLFVDEIMIH